MRIFSVNTMVLVLAFVCLLTVSIVATIYYSRLQNPPDMGIRTVQIRALIEPADIPPSGRLTYNSGMNAHGGDNYSQFVIWNQSPTTTDFGLEIRPVGESFTEIETLHLRGVDTLSSHGVAIGSSNCVVVTIPPSHLALIPFVVHVTRMPSQGAVYSHNYQIEVRTGAHVNCNSSTAIIDRQGTTVWMRSRFNIVIGRLDL